MQKLIHAAVHNTSFEDAEREVAVLAEVGVSAERIRRLTGKIGGERLAQREEQVDAFAKLSIPERRVSPLVPVPQVVCVQMDGGRVQYRERDQPRPAGQEKFWREMKVGDLRTFQSEVSEVDPSPTIPEVFLNRRRMEKIAREIKGFSAKRESLPQHAEREQLAEELLEEVKTERRKRPQPLVLSVVATRQDVHAFGPMLAAAAYERGFHAAARQAFVADGAEANWTVWRTHFSRYTPVLDFVHAISYVYAAAHAGRTSEEGWMCYARWAQWVWEGKVSCVIEELQEQQRAWGAPVEDDAENSPRQQTATTLGYLQNQQQRMRYDEYRRQGLPTTSSYVESTVKRLHRRVKGTEKFWSRGLEAMLILAGDYLSETNPCQKFWDQRRPTAIRCYQTAG
jgi:hypothetical protein